MAYNPFNIFRRNQKAIFAVVTVFIMFTFVLSSGLGGGADFFDWLPQWLGKKGNKGDVVCKLDGNKVHDTELRNLSYQRVVANDFMGLAATETIESLGQYVAEQFKLVTDNETRRLLREGPQAEAELQNPQMQMLRNIPEFAPRIQQLQATAAEYAALATSPTAKPAVKEMIRAIQYSQILQMQRGSSQGRHYFLNAPNTNSRDLVNFMLWQKKADQLGIHFTAEDVNRLIQKEFYGFFRSDVTVRKILVQRRPGFSLENCLKAIGEEFRVRTAQIAVFGPGMHRRSDKTFGGSPVFTPPYELFDYYREKCSPTTYEVVPVPVAGFLDKVAGEPSPADRKRLYDEYKNDEPNPARETPGFKIPRQVKLEWVSATGTEPYYLKLAAEEVKVGELQARVGSMMTIPLLGASPAWVAPTTAPVSMKEPLLQLDEVRREYNLQADSHKHTVSLEWRSPSFVTRLLDTSVVRPPNLAAALGGFSGSSLTFAGPLPGMGTLGTAARAFELRDRIRAGVPAFLGAVPGPGAFATMIGGGVASEAMIPKPLPIEVMKSDLMERVVKLTAKKLMLADLKTFSTEVAKQTAEMNKPAEAGKTKDEVAKKKADLKAALLKYVTDFPAARGWQRGESKTLRDEWTIEEDPGLAPLRAVVNKGQHGSLPVQFGKKFFWAEGGGMQGSQKTAATGTYKPEYYPNEPNQFDSELTSPEARQDPKFLVWRTEEAPAKLVPFPDAEKAIVVAWKRIQARELAKNRAEGLASAVRASAGDSAILMQQNLNELANGLRNEISDSKIKDRIKAFEISGVAPLTTGGPDFGMGMRNALRPFHLMPSSNVPYPTEDMTRTLLAERINPPKTTFILVDGPKDVYYVVTLLDRTVKSAQEFQFAVYSELFGGASREAVMRNFAFDVQKKTTESVIGLLKKEFKYEETDEQKKKLDESEKRGVEQE